MIFKCRNCGKNHTYDFRYTTEEHKGKYLELVGMAIENVTNKCECRKGEDDMNKIRGFEPVGKEFMKAVDAYVSPIRGDKRSAGYDISTPVDVVIPANGKAMFWTNVKAYMQSDEVLELYVRSSIGIKKGLILANVVGIIDSSYYSNPDNDGNIGVCLINMTDKEVVLGAGERVVQGIFKKYLTIDNDKFLNEDRSGGIGSTGTN